MATKSVSFHIGIGTYDPNVFLAASKLLSAADDARAMYNLATTLGYRALDLVSRDIWDGKVPRPPNVLIDEDAKYTRAVNLFRQSAALLQDEGDRCLITFSGHGTQFKKLPGVVNGDGEFNEAACLFDFPLVDDVICGLLGDFKKGVDVFLMLDCCHSGSTSEAILEDNKILLELVDSHKQPSTLGKAKVAAMPSVAPPQIPAELMAKFKGFDRGTLRANIAIFEACQDTETTFDGKNPGNLSVYTQKFVNAVGDGVNSVRAVADAIAVGKPTIANCNPRFQHTKNDAFLSKPMKA
jgi:hypothetical protein